MRLKKLKNRVNQRRRQAAAVELDVQHHDATPRSTAPVSDHSER